MPALISRKPQRALAVAALVAAALIGVAIWLAQNGRSAGTPDISSVRATRGDVVVSVGGVGRVVTGGVATVELPASGGSSGAGASGSTSASPSSAPADAVFPHVAGHVQRLFVQQGQHVAAGMTLAVIDDNGASASAVHQAALDLETARIELNQRLHSDPQKGIPPTAAEIAAAHAAVTSARADLAQTVGRTHAADLAAAQADVRRARADLQTLRGGTRAARNRALALAQGRVAAAQKRLDRVLTPGTPTDISAAQAEVKKAESDLAALQKPPATPLPEDITACPVRRDGGAERSRCSAGRGPIGSGRRQHRAARARQGAGSTRGAQAATAPGVHLRTGRGRRRAHEARCTARPWRSCRRRGCPSGPVSGAGRGANAARRAQRPGSQVRSRSRELRAGEGRPAARTGSRASLLVRRSARRWPTLRR